MRAVTLTQQDDTRTVVASGLTAGERVVTTGFTRLSDGTRVAVQASDGQPSAEQPAPARGPEARGEGRRKREAGEGGGEGRRKREGAESGGGKERRSSENAPPNPSVKQ